MYIFVPLFYVVHVTLLSNHRESADCRSEQLSYSIHTDYNALSLSAECRKV